MDSTSQRFIIEGQRLAAYDLARSGNARAWNSWRQQTDLLGDHSKTRINLSISNLSNNNLSEFNLTNVSFYRADLSRALLIGADCAHADFNQARLIGASFQRANLSRARLSRAYLRNADLSYADLRRADLRRASLTSAALQGARVEGVDLSSTRGLTQDQLEDARGDMNTRIPSHLEIPETWALFDLDRDIIDDEELDELRIIPSSVEVAVIAGHLQLSRKPGDAYFASTSDPALLRDEILKDIDEISPRCGNLPLLFKSLQSYNQELKKDDYDIILVGMRGLKIQAIFESVANDKSADGPELLAEAIGAVRAVLIQNFLFVSQSHRWKQFLEEASLAPYRNEDKETARNASQEVVSVLEEHKDACDIRVPQAVSAVTQELEISDDAQRLATFNVIASVENTFRGVITWVIKEAKRFLKDAWSTFRDNLAKVVGNSMAALVLALFSTEAAAFLAAKYPERFAWLVHAIKLLDIK